MSNVLVVDDHPLNANLARVILSRAGHVVRVATSASEALVAVRAARPDIVLTDINMPKVSGRELCRVLREQFGRGELRIVAYTAMAMKDELDAIRTDGFDDIVVKPVTREALLAAVTSI